MYRDDPQQVALLRARIAELESELKKITELERQGAPRPSVLEHVNQTINNRIAQLERETAELKTHVDYLLSRAK